LSTSELESLKRLVRPLAAETLGVRSLAVYIESVAGPVLLDPSFAVVPRRFGLPPHPWEIAAAWVARTRLGQACESAETLVVTHFHYDHMMAPERRPFEFYEPATRTRCYSERKLLVRSVSEPINFRQMQRGKELLRQFPDAVQADGLDLGWIRFSGPIPHGPVGSKQGWTFCCCVQTTAGPVAFGDDTQLMTDESLDWLLSCEPKLAITSGPALLRASAGGQAGPSGSDGDPIEQIADPSMLKGLERLVKLAQQVPAVIVDHHMARSKNFPAVLRACSARAGRKIYSVAEWLDEPLLLLEAYRKFLHKAEPVHPEWYKRFDAGDSEILDECRDMAGRLDRVAALIASESAKQ